MDDSSTMTGGDDDKSQPKFAINNLSVDTSRECQPLCEALSSGTDSFSSFGGICCVNDITLQLYCLV